ncbi:hypothetical protein ACHAW6_002188, partial [Cyclotella cf. meneghiniana]
MQNMKSVYAVSILLATATSAKLMAGSEVEMKTFEIDKSRRLGKSGKGSSKGSKGGSSKSSKGSEDCEPKIIYKYIYVPMPPPEYVWDSWSDGWGGDESSPMPTPSPMWGGSDEDWSGGWGGGKSSPVPTPAPGSGGKSSPMPT